MGSVHSKHPRASSGRKSAERAVRPAPGRQIDPPAFDGPLSSDQVLHLQATVGNRVVQRYLAHRKVVQRDGDGSVMYMDASGTAHKEPDKSKAPAVIHMDPSGVGHKAPDKAPAAPSVIHMDAFGVGHKTPDKAPAAPNVIYQDPAGVGHVPPQNFGAAVQSIRKTFALVKAARAIALAKRKEAQAALAAAKAHWNVEAANSGLSAAREAAKAGAAATAARDQSRNKQDWLFEFASAHSLLSTAPVKVRTGAWQDISVAAKAEDHVRPLETSAAAAEKAAADAMVPLRRPGSGPWVVVGQLQQKLNATRAGGGRLSVHGLFTPETETALKAFQAAEALTASGVADVPTWKALRTKAPSRMENDQLVVDAKGGAQQAVPVNGKVHPDLKKGSKGAGVREMQQRLNNWLAVWAGPGAPPFKKLKVDGSFGSPDRTALRAFQKANGLPETDVADLATWAKLDAVGAVTEGNREFGWRETVEGVSNVGTTAKYNWEVKGDKITITVKIKFTGASGHAMVSTWLKDITDVWNAYKAVEVGKAAPREYKIEFKPEKTSSGWHKVRVGKPTKKDPNPRSNSANWYVNDTRKGLAPHEFGHLVGLEDEYNRPEEESVAASGLEPTIGAIASGSGKSAKEVADELHAVIAGNTAKTPAARIADIRAKVQGHGLVPGAFSRLVEAHYRGSYGFGTAANLAGYFGEIAGPGFHTDLSVATAPFLVSNTSLMGTMESVGARGANLKALPDHDHPVQPRHVRPFAQLIALSFPGTKWEPKRR